MEIAVKRMKSRAKNNKPMANGAILTRKALLAAHERSLRHDDQMTAEEGFEALVRAGIVSRNRKLTRRYGGNGKNQISG